MAFIYPDLNESVLSICLSLCTVSFREIHIPCLLGMVFPHSGGGHLVLPSSGKISSTVKRGYFGRRSYFGRILQKFRLQTVTCGLHRIFSYRVSQKDHPYVTSHLLVTSLGTS